MCVCACVWRVCVTMCIHTWKICDLVCALRGRVCCVSVCVGGMNIHAKPVIKYSWHVCTVSIAYTTTRADCNLNTVLPLDTVVLQMQRFVIVFRVTL